MIPLGRSWKGFTEEVLKTCGNRRRPTRWEQAETLYSELSIVREAATVTCFWQKLKDRQRREKDYTGKREGSRLDWWLLARDWERATEAGLAM